MKHLIKVFVTASLLSSCSCPKAWEITYGGNSVDAGYSVDITSDGKYIIAGEAFTNGRPDSLLKNIDFETYLLKVDKCSNVNYSKAFSFPYLPDPKKISGGQLSTSIQKTKDNGYIVAGANLGSSKIGGYNFELIKFKPDASSGAQGIIDWDNIYGGSDNDGNPNGELLPTLALETGESSTTGYTLAGSTASFHGNKNPGVGKYDYFLLHTDKNGAPAWAYAYAGGDSVNYYMTSFCKTTDGGYIMCGYILMGSYATSFITKSYVIKTDVSGNSAPPYGWSKTYEIDTPYQQTQAMSIQPTFDGNYVITGWARNTNNNNHESAFLLKIASDGSSQWVKTYNIEGSEAKTANNEAHYVQQTGNTKNSGFIIAGVSGGGIDKDGAFLMHTDKFGIPDWTNSYGNHDDIFFSVKEIKNSDGIGSGYIATGKTQSDTLLSSHDVFIVKTDTHGITPCSKKLNPNVDTTLQVKVNNIVTYQTSDLVATHALQFDSNHATSINWGKQNYKCK